jgi:putative transposase
MARIVIPGVPHHVTHRGNLRAQVFLNEQDRLIYQQLLAECAQRFFLEIWAYCLMGNHVHLIVVGQERNSLAKALGMAHQRYAAAVNRRERWTGHLWANRFFSTPLDDQHLWAAVRYVELNPVRARLVDSAEQWPWSSAASHCGARPQDFLLSARRPFPGHVDNWREWLACGLEPATEARIRTSTYTGRPCGSEAFIAEMERVTGRVLSPRKRGRKPRQSDGLAGQQDLFGWGARKG